MTATAVALLVVAGLVALIDWWSVAADRLNIEFMAKPLVMIALVGTALAHRHYRQCVARLGGVGAGGSRWWVTLFSSTPDARFELGLFSFLVAHLLYVLAFFDHIQWIPALVAAVLIAVISFLVVPKIFGAVRAQSRMLAVAVVAYMLALGATAVAASSTGIVVAALGGAAFFVSDSLLGWDRFVGPTPGGRKMVMITYHLGQAGLVTWLAVV